MVPDVEREWIAEEARSTPRSCTGLILTLIAILGLVLLLCRRWGYFT
jgi:hypothetical protein